MKIIKYLILFCFVVFSVSINAQIDTKGKSVKLSSNDKVKLDKHFNKYKTFTFDKSQVIDSLKHKRKCSFSINIDEKDKLELSLELNDLRGEKYKATFISDSGEVEFKGYFPNTYKGKTKKGEVARFTIDKENFYGTIIGNNQTKIIKSAKSVDESISEDIFVVFDLTDVVKTEKELLPDFTDALEVPDASLKSASTLKTAICTYYLEVATDADFEYYQAMGSNLSVTYSNIFTVLNIIEGVYESTFDLRLVVTFQNVWTTSTDPYTSTDYTTVCNELRDEWETNRTIVTRDIAHLFTGKSTNSAGAAWRAHIGDTWSYGFSRNRNEMFETTAHEIGHNLGARDVNLMSIVPPECLWRV